MSEQQVQHEHRGHRKTRVGTVVSDKMQKTVVVAIQRRVPHPTYGKIVRKSSRFKAHDENNAAKVGDLGGAWDLHRGGDAVARQAARHVVENEFKQLADHARRQERRCGAVLPLPAGQAAADVAALQERIPSRLGTCPERLAPSVPANRRA